ncbi:4-hydroxy-3-methylbut-2-enyl diphosphate reductase [Porphyromonas circumdentaria]|uniref:4-hydroxy-3-methylbut-2-enyl diphosphate reductase n=1 Tax=Porphyromonas circumdentaria TaxID=29524 RepID=A0A1T4P565_9PORP|nr:4-hydroxy-3-methylbut-2-enyl diphosphate reductase [Porphyromonas circumdentaria]MBB6276309.1 4-hydroxy-3-methylbut-2-enyl diphosphate reductase [Porphyromonas circumdentaria]MDO4722580.1 4-hydroxy-3-methylbut-2-enyl diphosphate reductase [Porphyromonas circumdentaria]SJZ86740.1 4-hydroxy-3-methylbut-2-enyl diphosphate reductase [Porphyromonas circumdentaria]
MISIEIDARSGFCYGVVNAIKKAEEEMQREERDFLYCLGDIVHNTREVDRLEHLGLKTINYDQFEELKGKKVLFRAHGEPPSTYLAAQKRGLTIVDATCPVVLRLQQRIRKCYEESRAEQAQIVIFGKRGHAEVNGLVGQTNGEAIVIQSVDEIEQLDFSRPIYLHSQTTMPLDVFEQIVEGIKGRMAQDVPFYYVDTICRQVAMRIPHIKEFAQQHDRIFFIAGKKSSNGKVLFEECRAVNANTFFLSDKEDLREEMLPPLTATEFIGICGATSTPMWQMEELASVIAEHYGEGAQIL